MFRVTFPAACLAVLLAAPAAFAQPSLDERDTATVTVDLKSGDKVAFQVYRDGRRREQFYYLPDSVRLFERTVNGQQVPQFTLLRYDFADQNNPTAPSGGILQFAAMMGATPEAFEKIKATIPAAFKLPKDAAVQLASIPVKSAKVALYAGGKDSKLVTAAYGEGAAPLSDTQRMIFQMDLSQAGADVYDALTRKGQGGVGVAVTVDFNGLTPAAQVRIVADYRLIATHYSKNDKTKTALAASAFGGALKASAEFKSDYLEAIDDLKKSGALTVDVYGSEAIPAVKLNELFVAPVLARINQQILELQKSPDKAVPATAPDPKADAEAGGVGGYGFAAAYGRSVSVKNLSDIRDYKETVDLKFRDVVPRQTVVGGFIGIGNYDDKLKGQLSITTTRGFPTAILKLPVLGDNYFQTGDFRTWVTNGDDMTKYYSGVHQWKKGADGWKTAQGVVADYAQFGFTTLPQGLDGKDWTKFKLHSEFEATTTAGQKVRREGEAAALYGTDKATGPDSTSHAIVEVDWLALPWAANLQALKPGDVINVSVLARQGANEVVRAVARPVDEKGAFQLPPTTRVYCERAKGAVSLELMMIVIGPDNKPARKTWSPTEDMSKFPSVVPLMNDFK